MRCPVTKGWAKPSLRRTGRATLAGHFWAMLQAPPPSSRTTGSSTECAPPRTSRTLPPAPGGARMRWMKLGVSCTVPSTSPGPTSCPGATAGWNSQRRSSGRGSALRPRPMKSPPVRRSSASGRWMPSNTLPSRPGPRLTSSDSPVPATGSPTHSPEVSS